MANGEIRDPRMREIVAEDAAFEQFATGFMFTEGPLWHPKERHLTFSDMPGDIMRQWDERRGVTTFRKPCFKSNGLAYDREGRLIVCEHASSRVTRTNSDGTQTVLASHWQGRELNSPNDIVCRSDGALYFTDPTYGRMDHFGLKRPLALDFRGVYRIDPQSSVLSLLASDFKQPNGLCFSLDERRLFVNDTDRQHIRVFDVGGDGLLADGGVWAETKGQGEGAPDGMKTDAAGNVYCCGPGGIHVFAPDATSLGVLKVPEYVANFCWGGDDMRSLFITASKSLYRIRTLQPGRALI